MIEVGDGAPSDTARTAIDESCGGLNKALAGWRQLGSQDFSTVNTLLAKYKLAPLPAPPPASGVTDGCAY
jgi:hypothetical protein